MNKTSDKEPEAVETPRVLLSNADAYVHDRMKGQPKTLDEVDIKVIDKEGLEGKHRLSLPEELEPFKSKYGFRWLFKNKQAIDYACDVRGWVLVNRTYFPDLPRHLFTVSGSIERGDSILSFIPREKAIEILKEPGEKSNQVKQAAFEKHRDDPRFYSPKESKTEEGIKDNVVMI